MGNMRRRKRNNKTRKKAKNIVPECFHKWLKLFGKKNSKHIPTIKV